MPDPDLRSRRTAILIDTNVIIEAVRIGLWSALTGGLRIETVAECRDETQRKPPHVPGYVVITSDHLDRLCAIHAVGDVERATLALQYADAANLDPGERDLVAHGLARLSNGDSIWVVCSPDKALVRAAVALGWADRTCSLEELIEAVGERVPAAMAKHFGTAWLSSFRTACLLGR